MSFLDDLAKMIRPKLASPVSQPQKVSPNYSLGTRLLTSLPQLPNTETWLPKALNVSLPRSSSANPLIQKPANFALSVAEGILNTPKTSLTHAAQLTNEAMQGRLTPQSALGHGAGIAELPLSFVGGTGAVKSVGKSALEQGFKQALKIGAASGVKYGAGFGTLSGLAQNYDAKSLPEQLVKTLPSTAIGAVTGGALGGVGAAVAHPPVAVVRKVADFLQKKNPKLSRKDAIRQSETFVWDETVGRTRNALNGKFSKPETSKWVGKSTPTQDAARDLRWSKNPPKLNQEIKDYLKSEYGVDDIEKQVKSENGFARIPGKESNAKAQTPKPVSGPELTLPKGAGLSQFWDRSRNVIEKQGPSGQKLAQGLKQSREVAETSAGTWVQKLPTVRQLKGKEFENFVDVAEGKATPLSNRVSQAVKEWASVRDEIYTLAKESGLEIGRLENYFPHSWDESAFKGKGLEQIIEHLVTSGQAKTPSDALQIVTFARQGLKGKPNANLELERLLDAPGYEKNWNALSRYIESASNRIAQTKTFGRDYEGAKELIGKVGSEGGDMGAVSELFDISVGNKSYGDNQQKISKALRGYNTVTKLGLGAVTNVGQSVNTATVTGSLRTLLSAPKAAFSDEARDFALKSGITLDGVLNDLREGAGFSGKVLGKISAPGFNKVERFNRTLAAWSGKGYAEDLGKQAAKGSKGAVSELQKMGLDPGGIIKRNGVLTEEEQIRAARNIVERTQFKVDPQDLPGWASSPWGKVLTQFKTFAYNQSAFIGREIIEPATKGNVAPLLRFMMLSVPVGGAITETRNFLQNRDSEEDPTKRLVQYFQKAGGLGLASDVYTGLFPQNGKYLPQDRAVTLALGTIGGPTIGTAADLYGSVSQAVQGKPDSLKRFALRQVPIAGPTLQNTLMPYKQKPAVAGANSKSGGNKSLDPEAMLSILQSIKGTTGGAGTGRKLTAKQQQALISSIKQIMGKNAPKVTAPRQEETKVSTVKVKSSKSQTKRLSKSEIDRLIRIVRS